MSARGPAQASEPVDGRVQRGERSRQRIVAALFDLVGAGVLQPTAQQVAARAGVGMRTVFRHFSEMETLYAAMNGRLDGEVRPALMAARRVGPLSERVAGLVRQRARLFERVAPYKRAANLQRWRSRYLEGRHRVMQRDLRADLLTGCPSCATRRRPPWRRSTWSRRSKPGSACATTRAWASKRRWWWWSRPSSGRCEPARRGRGTRAEARRGHRLPARGRAR